jgi:hypothetical protein
MQAWSEPGALTGMLNWYRATLRYAKRANGVHTHYSHTTHTTHHPPV